MSETGFLLRSQTGVCGCIQFIVESFNQKSRCACIDFLYSTYIQIRRCTHRASFSLPRQFGNNCSISKLASVDRVDDPLLVSAFLMDTIHWAS